MRTEDTGKLIAERRKEMGLTQQQLAAMLDVSDKAVSKWETGRSFPDMGILERLSAVTGLGIVEILKGERVESSLNAAEVQTIAGEGLAAVRRSAKKRTVRDILVGAMAAILVLALAVIRMTSPISLVQARPKIVEMGDMLVAVLPEEASGYDLRAFDLEETGKDTASIRCYTTVAHRLFGKGNTISVVIGRIDEIERVLYYPTGGSDERIWPVTDSPDTLTSITVPYTALYRFWKILFAVATVIGCVAFALLRRSRWSRVILKISMLSLSMLVSTCVCTAGRGYIFDGLYYMSGILLLGVVVWLFLMLLYGRWREEKADREAGASV